MRERDRLFDSLTGKHWVVSPDDLLKKLSTRAPEQIKPHEGAADAVADFLRKLAEMPKIDGVAFVAIEQHPGPMTVSIIVCAPLIRDSRESADILKRVGNADAQLAEVLSPIVHSGLSFINSDGANINQIEESIRARCQSDSQERLLGFCTFDRTPQQSPLL